MGKQGKRKQRQKRKQKQPIPDGTADAAAQPLNPSSAIHQLRHADSHVRLNALVALQATLLRPSGSKRININVMQAVREQVMDANLECASSAADCLAQYLSLPNLQELASATTAGWVLVFITRLNQCLQAIQGKSQNNNKLKQWYAVAAPSLRALAKLIETNPLALDQLNTQIDTFLATVLGLLQSVATFQLPAGTTDKRFSEWVQETGIYATRCLHSSLDDNEDVAERFASMDVNVWISLLPTLPDLAQVHVCGSFVALQTPAMVPGITQQVIPCLVHRIQQWNPQQIQTLEAAYNAAVTLWKAQQEDEQLEGEIVRKVQERKEPARLIARRQQNIERNGKATIEETQDGEQAMEDALVAWNACMLPLQVALEVSANLLSSFMVDEAAMEEDGAGAGGNDDVRSFLVSSNFMDPILTALNAMCVYYTTGRTEAPDSLLKEDLEEVISKCAACATNGVLSQILSESKYEQTWQMVRPYASAKGVGSTLVVLAQRGTVNLSSDGALVQQLLSAPHEDSQRDGVCLLATMLVNAPENIVVEATTELVRLLQTSSSVAVQVEILRTIMDLWGQDDFYPQLFDEKQILSCFQTAATTLSKNKDLDPESEEILYNAERFVEYKQGR
eukprot:Nitzschia sp. Nitz4//scaffold129_size63868//47726//49588//NITZ4_006203-RA/size63868-processed-gene-0.62-mRNA-1//1//CDS//3329534917//2357//frame0